jgi:predicted CoA-binding protein
MDSDRRRTRDVLDAQEGTGPVPILDSRSSGELLRRARRIAIVGASPSPLRPSHRVMRYLLDQGYDVVPINPTVTDVLGVPAFAKLAEATAATGRFDIVDVFRRPEHAPAIAAAAVEAGAGALWLQLGVVSWEAAAIAHAASLPVVMDRCTAIEHRRAASIRHPTR